MNHPVPRLLNLPRLAAIGAIMLLSGCLTIEEHYTFKKDGSGTMEYVMDLSEIGSMMDALGSSDQGEDGGKKAKQKKKDKAQDDSMLAGMEAQAKQLEQLQGIKKVKMKTEKDGYLGRLSFAFADVAALNRALNVLMPDSTRPDRQFFRWEGAVLVRTGSAYARNLGTEMTGDGSDSLDISQVLESMKYKFSFAFANDVQDVGAAYGVVVDRPKPKQLELATDWRVIMNDPKALDLRIVLDK
ncbi:MAG: hypothetical protein J5I62_09450 [Flavobacteriales bacterium]|nr:hypothetical protein [Flavobacteriales bacterium]MEB2341908.1 hypothetical protein [Flavobacteriia bacterium]